MDRDSLLKNNQRLREEITKLKRENQDLRAKVAVFENHPALSDGVRGESLISSLVNGTITSASTPYDVFVEHSGIMIEVKFSRLNRAVRGSTTMRWNWDKPFGESGKKVYDYLMLIGEKDRRYLMLYLDRACPYIIFDIPYDEVIPLTIKSSRHKDGFSKRLITLTTNPQTARSAASPLFKKYQVTLAIIKERYGL